MPIGARKRPIRWPGFEFSITAALASRLAAPDERDYLARNSGLTL